jgi:sirohydrochlorin ferrochelatase
MKTAVLLMAHGSRIPEANDAVREIAAMVKEITGFDIVEVSFRERHLPNIQQGIDACAAQGAERIILLPYFLYMGAHV